MVEELRVLREEMVAVEEEGVWNEVLGGLRGRLRGGGRGGERREVWRRVKGQGLGWLGERKVEEGEEVGEGFWGLR